MSFIQLVYRAMLASDLAGVYTNGNAKRPSYGNRLRQCRLAICERKIAVCARKPSV